MTALIVLPWLLPGYIFATDFAGPRHFAFPDSPASYAGLQASLAAIALIAPSELVGKLLIVAILLTASVGAFLAFDKPRFEVRAVAALIYLFNPFVYDRLAYGQLTVLAGYAVLPWALTSVRTMLESHSWKHSLRVAAFLTVISVLDIHMALIASAAAAILIIVHVALAGRTARHLSVTARQIAVTAGATLVASSYWLVPLVLGLGPQARTLARIGPGDLAAFTTVSDPTFGVVGNVLGLFGFWGEDTGRFTSSKDFVPLWPAVMFALVALTVFGAVIRWREGGAARSWAVGMVILGLVAIVLDIGISSTYVAPMVKFLNNIFPPYRGMRDSGKWAGLLAFAYAQLIPASFGWFLDFAKRNTGPGVRRDIALATVTSVVMALPLYYGNGLLYGMHSQIRPSAYPSGWYAADAALTADPHPGRAVFLPFHGYMEFSFIRNQNQVVSSPAPNFFSIPTIASEDLEVEGVLPPLDDPDQALLARLISAGGQADWGQELASRGFKYVLLARELDWKSYEYLDTQSHLSLVRDYGSILLYRNLAWR